MDNILGNREVLVELLHYRMPYGKYKDYLLLDIPVHYLEWMATKGFPAGKLGMLLHTTHVIKTNGLMDVIEELKKVMGK